MIFPQENNFQKKYYLIFHKNFEIKPIACEKKCVEI
jgi:hypothetical protein